MEVTRKNFIRMLPSVQDSIKKADFLVIDAEFTGLINGKDVSAFDTPSEYYTTLLNGTSEFLLIQFGLCAFYWNEEKKHYMNDAYNFYLFPRGRPGPEKTFLCQSSSLDFLASQGFDFNKLIREGISYMTGIVEERLRENLTERQNCSNERDTITIPEENKQFIDDVCKKVRVFLDEKKLDEIEIDRCNGFVRRLLFQELGKKFKDEAFLETKILDNKDRVLRVIRIKSTNEVKDRDTLKKEKEWEDFEEAVGFSKVARMISESEKLIVGHNMLLDVLHTLNHFFHPLPSDYISFKGFANMMFPKLLDTKYMSSLPPFKDKVNSSVLQHLLGTLSEPPFSIPHTESINGQGYSQVKDKSHEAGFDAYITGLCFLAMHTHLCKMRGESNHRVATPDSTILKPFLNKLFLAKTAYQDSPYINLVGDDPSPSRDHVFHVTFPKDWVRNDINNLFSPYGPVTVQFIDDHSAFVALIRRNHTKNMFRALRDTTRVRIVPFAKYKETLSKKKSPPTTALTSNTQLNTGTPDFAPRKPQGTNTAITSTSLPVKVERSATNDVMPPISSDNVYVPILNLDQSGDSIKTDEEATLPVARGQVANQSESDGSFEKSSENNKDRSKGASRRTAVRNSRKRTSSGVFQNDPSEPSPKKSEVVSDIGRRKHPSKKEKVNKQKKTVELQKFDDEATSKTVTAFQESDSWD